MVMTSGYNFEGYDIVSYIGHESVQVVLGTGMFSSIDASVADFFGTRSSAYEDKLDMAEAAGKKKLLEKAKKNGGNAIIGLDVDYTTFTKDVIAVIVGGTIVKIERKMPEKGVKRMCNMENNTSIPFRISDVVIVNKIDSEKLFVGLSGQNYSDSAIEGFVAKLKMETIFNDVVEISEITFADIQQSEDGEITTEYNLLKLEDSIFKTIKSVSVQIIKYVTENNEIIEVSESNNEKIEKTQQQMMNIRKLYGDDAVDIAYTSEDSWICYCGMKNDNREHTCRRCKREMQMEKLRPGDPGSAADEFCLEDHLAHIDSLDNAKEIYDYLFNLDCSSDRFNTIVLPEIQKYVDCERMYGSMKSSVISKLMELYS